MSKNSAIKDKVRKTKEWKEFRENLIEEQKTDPITGKKLQRGCNCHHLDLDINHYDQINNERQVMLNRQSHEVVHFFYGDERHKKDWRSMVKGLIEVLERMDSYNNINNNVEFNIAD